MNQAWTVFIYKNAIGNVVYELPAILSRPRCAESHDVMLYIAGRRLSFEEYHMIQ